MNNNNIQIGHIARHTPKNAASQGREAAIIDVAQDLLLQHLHKIRILDTLIIKGGTAIRKLYAGQAGRFSLDLDFSFNGFDANQDSIVNSFISAVDGLRIEPFTYSASQRRGKWNINFESHFSNEQSLSTKLDFSPSPWLKPIEKSWVKLPIHAQYAQPLPEIKTIRLEENIAEKIARLNRATPARDMYDLCWAMTTASISQNLDKTLIRHLAVLKIWVDANGLHASDTYWKQGHQKTEFIAENWLRDRSADRFDVEDIGALAVPTPTQKELSKKLRKEFAFLNDLSEEELIVANSDERDRSLVIKLLKKLPDSDLSAYTIY
ncbi:MAG: nucleotidyl transferase AbiEii/AbiGii toxin family protein [Anaerovoracaceae bacterium]